MSDIWNKRREILEKALIDDVLNLFDHTGSNAFELSIPGTSPVLNIKVGDFSSAAAVPVASVPDGCVLMPRNPPNGMLSAMADTLEDPNNERSSWDLASNMYAAAIAYLTPTNQEGAAP